MKGIIFYKIILSLFKLFIKKKFRETSLLPKISLIIFIAAIAFSTFFLITYVEQFGRGNEMESKHYLLSIASKLFVPYFLTGFVARILLQPLPYYYLNPIKVLNISKLNIATLISMLSFFNSNNYFSFIISCLGAWAIYLVKGGILALNFLAMNFLLMLVLNILVASLKIVAHAMLCFLIAAAVTFACATNFQALLENSTLIFFELTGSWTYLFFLVVLSAFSLSIFIKLIQCRLYSE
ncbi:MAG: hypothetical protein KF862_23070 [Chitinophagaceae bacterium]|nr:hypothetical protein [Chitinophagaceae bacterium]